MATNLTDLCDLYPIHVHPLETFGYDEVIEDVLLPSSFNICPQLLFHPNEPFLQEGLCQRDGKQSFFSEEVIWDAISGDPFYDCLTKYIETTQVDDQFIPSFKDNDVNMIPNISNCLVPNDAIMYDIDMEGFDHNYPALGEELEVVMLSENDSKSLACPIDFDIYEGILRSFMLELHDNELIDNQLEVEVLETVGSSLKKHGVVLEESGNNDLIGEVVYTPDDDDPGRPGYAFSCHNFSAKCPDSCRTQCEVRGLLGSEYSINKNKRISSLHSNSEDHTSDPDAWPSNFVSIPPSNEYQMDDADEHLKNFFEKSQRRRRKAEKRERKGRRPRDRQLIQDRIKELRELIPNGTQCSIDELLERTVKHMMFLQSIAVRAEKLNQSIRSKVGGKQLEIHRITSQTFPLIIENLEQPDQLLIEVECRDHGVFLEMAQAFKRLKMTIHEATLENQSEVRWARFILQVRMCFRNGAQDAPHHSFKIYKLQKCDFDC